MSGTSRDIGFNDDVVAGDVHMHVQTEIVGRAPGRIVTNVMDRGRVAHSESRPLPSHDVAPDWIRETASAQHAAVIALVKEGGVR